MCPSYRATGNETHVTRGRANALRLALSGQLGKDAFLSNEMKEAMSLCIGCKSCKRECPTGVDMARMKMEFQHHHAAKFGLTLRDRLVGWLPRYAPLAARFGPLLNAANRISPLRWLMERTIGFAATRPLPEWRKPWQEKGNPAQPGDVRGDRLDLILFGDTFNRAFEPENLAAAERVLGAAGYRLHRVDLGPRARPACCGRTFLSVGRVDEARTEAGRLIEAYLPYIERGARIVGLEPSCLLTLRDEMPAFMPGAGAKAIARAAFMIEEILASDLKSQRISLGLEDQNGRIAHLHGHCHQKAADAMGAVEACLAAVPGLVVRPIESSCCGMAGSFGYQAETLDVSIAMAELSLLPVVREAGPDDLIVADGTSCRHQIADGAGREAQHVVRVLDKLMKKREK
jgi:Fe-S oxidoreductase